MCTIEAQLTGTCRGHEDHRQPLTQSTENELRYATIFGRRILYDLGTALTGSIGQPMRRRVSTRRRTAVAIREVTVLVPSAGEANRYPEEEDGSSDQRRAGSG